MAGLLIRGTSYLQITALLTNYLQNPSLLNYFERRLTLTWSASDCSQLKLLNYEIALRVYEM